MLAARRRRRLADPAAAGLALRRAEWSVRVVVAGVVAAALVSLSPRLPAGLQRLWLVGLTIGLLTGLPFALERRALRRRLAAVATPLDPLQSLVAVAGDPRAPAVDALLAGDHRTAAERLTALIDADPPDLEALRVRGLVAVAAGDARAGRLYALRAVQVDPARWDVADDVGVALCRAGRVREGIRLLEKATELAPTATTAWLTLAWGLGAAGRLRDAATALDAAQGRPVGLPRRPGAARRG